MHIEERKERMNPRPNVNAQRQRNLIHNNMRWKTNHKYERTN